VKSITETVPLVGADVEVKLLGPGGKTFDLASGKTGLNGAAELTFKTPELPTGKYALEVYTRSQYDKEKLKREVQIRSGAKILLVTDKPLYQPAQVMRIRALALRPFDLKPVAGTPLVFEVEDAKGNKVFKRTQTTSDFGVAAVDFQLADEVNMGDYHVRAIAGDQQADKTVAVKRYVLPKFKSELTVDKRFYLPKETVHADLQTDYFFGKPVARGKVKVTASTFDVQFKEFQTWEGATDANGHAKFDIKLPDYFVGQPLQKGDALLRLEVKVTDTADHAETISKSYTVSDQPIRVSLIPEGGRLIPAMENRIFAAAIYPDGSPAPCQVKLWTGRTAKGQALATLQTNEAGLAEFKLTPKEDQFRAGNWAQRQVEMVGRTSMAWAPNSYFDVYAEAADSKGNTAHTVAEINSEPQGENILMRLGKAIYQAGDTLQVDLRTSSGLPTVYLDLVKNGQTMLSRWLETKNGKAGYSLDLPAELFGTLEVHAYQMLATGEIIRDSRVIYVQPGNELKVDVRADKDVYQPGGTGKIRFQITDRAGRPTAAALGVIIVDEAVYALQELQPGLEKVYFTLQEELLKPKTQIVYKPRESIDNLVRESALPADKQQIAQVLLTSVQPKPPAIWQVAPEVERRQQVEAQIQQIGMSLLQLAAPGNPPFLRFDRDTNRWVVRPDLLNGLDASLRKDPLGRPWTWEGLAKVEKHFTPERLARAATLQHMQQLFWAIINYTNAHRAEWHLRGSWKFPDNVIAAAGRSQGMDARWLRDAWGRTIRLVQRKQKAADANWDQFAEHELVSAGPDREFGTEDDIKFTVADQSGTFAWWWVDERSRLAMQNHGPVWRGMARNGNMLFFGAAPAGAGGGMMGGARAGRMMRGMAVDGAEPLQMMAAPMAVRKGGAAALEAAKDGAGVNQGAGAQPTRVREFFPETLLWQPALITDDRGQAELPVEFADSITTWRLSASASSRGGSLGGVTAPLRVFQDFFVDLDLPVTLTQNDEVAFPVAVYNYLKTPQTVKLELQREPWFDLVDAEGFTRSLDLKPNQVTAVKFRLKARQIGSLPLTVKASGSHMSDAVKRTIEVVPDGTRIEKVVTDRLTGKIKQTIEIPPNAIPDASKILVKVYPGIFSQVMEGMEGMMRMPFG
jgi:hypothetical protein